MQIGNDRISPASEASRSLVHERRQLCDEFAGPILVGGKKSIEWINLEIVANRKNMMEMTNDVTRVTKNNIDWRWFDGIIGLTRMESNSDFSGARCGEKKRGINLKIKMARFR